MKPTIAFLTGGYSGEAVISYKSAITIEKNLDPDKYIVYKIDVRTDGWWHESISGEQVLVNKNNFSLTLAGKEILFDAVFIGIHGTPGEDGKLQGYFDMLKIPYTACDAATSALTFNKRYTVAVAAFAGVAVAKSLHLFKHSPLSVLDVGSQLQFPVFVKPNNGGSSIGISKVSNMNLLGDAIDKAFNEDDQILVEECISGREFTIGVYKHAGNIHVLPITEIITQNEFFDYAAKYEGKSEEVTPADVEDSIAEQIRKQAAKVYSIFNCRGVVRMDFIYNTERKQPFLLEINTVPGQSAASIIPQQVQTAGLSLMEFYSMLLDEALA